MNAILAAAMFRYWTQLDQGFWTPRPGYLPFAHILCLSGQLFGGLNLCQVQVLSIAPWIVWNSRWQWVTKLVDLFFSSILVICVGAPCSDHWQEIGIYYVDSSCSIHQSKHNIYGTVCLSKSEAMLQCIVVHPTKFLLTPGLCYTVCNEYFSLFINHRLVISGKLWYCHSLKTK